jgi:hypothetical protein
MKSMFHRERRGTPDAWSEKPTVHPIQTAVNATGLAAATSLGSDGSGVAAQSTNSNGGIRNANTHPDGETMRKNLPSLSALYAFEATSRHLSFSRAAIELNLTQGASGRSRNSWATNYLSAKTTPYG